MTPTPPEPKPTAWWQTLLASLGNLALAILANHYLGPAAAAGSIAVGTAAAHLAHSPLQRQP